MNHPYPKITTRGATAQLVYRDLAIEIKNWMHNELGSDYFKTEFPSGSWNYYVTIHERKAADFSKLWLADEVKEFLGSGRKYVTQDYYSAPLSQIEMHGGITYYEKHGHVEGFRAITIGCDYAHLHDTRQEYRYEDVLADAVRTIDSIYELGLIAVPAEAPAALPAPADQPENS